MKVERAHVYLLHERSHRVHKTIVRQNPVDFINAALRFENVLENSLTDHDVKLSVFERQVGAVANDFRRTG